MSSVYLFLVTLSSLKLTSINYEVAVEIVQYYGLIGTKTDDVICLCGSIMNVVKKVSCNTV
jgi:hypothetical protein